MHPRIRSNRLRSAFQHGSAVACLIPTLVVLGSCARDSSRAVDPLEPQFGPGGGPPVKVDAADPASAEQGTTLDVRVLGSNFEPGSNTSFELNGVPAGKVRTNSTTFVSSDELIANITIDADADVGYYDVEVITPRGKKGVGTELFSVQVAGGGPEPFPSTSLTVTVRDAVGDAISSDGAGPYVDNVSGIRAFVYLGQDFEGQIHLNTDFDDKDPLFRTLDLQLAAPGGGQSFFSGQTVARFVINGSELDAFNALGVGESIYYRAHLQFEDSNARYDLRFGSECGGGAERPAERLLITLVQESPRIWAFSHVGEALLCVVPAKGHGKPQPDYSVVVSAPFEMLFVEQTS